MYFSFDFWKVQVQSYRLCQVLQLTTCIMQTVTVFDLLVLICSFGFISYDTCISLYHADLAKNFRTVHQLHVFVGLVLGCCLLQVEHGRLYIWNACWDDDLTHEDWNVQFYQISTWLTLFFPDNCFMFFSFLDVLLLLFDFSFLDSNSNYDTHYVYNRVCNANHFTQHHCKQL